MDKLSIHHLRIPTIIGVWPQERETLQEITISLEISIDAASIAVIDELKCAIDYADVCNKLKEYIAHRQDQLLETLAHHTAGFILGEFPVDWLKLTMTKKPCDIPNLEGVSVVIERNKG